MCISNVEIVISFVLFFKVHKKGGECCDGAVCHGMVNHPFMAFECKFNAFFVTTKI